MGKEKEEKVYALFDILLIVELQQDLDGKTSPFISYRYPQFEKFEKDPFSSSVTQFCFPDINQFPTETMESEKFSFVLTEGDGEKRFGYCIRKLHPGNGPRYPLAFSIMAFLFVFFFNQYIFPTTRSIEFFSQHNKYPCFTLYTKILEEVMYHYENTSLRMLSDFLCTVLANPFPLPGNSFEVKIGNSQQPNSTKFTRPDDSDSQIDHVDLDTLLLLMNERNILTIFSSMLIERRIIFCSSKLSSLSSCIQTAVALLYPFTWQHIYIPVLPKSLLSFCCAPMPFVVGILASELNEVLMLPMDEVLIINLDEDCFIRTPDPEMSDLDYLPPGSIDNLKKSLKDTCRMIKKYQKKKKGNKTDDMGDKVLEYELKKQKGELKENFLQFFVYFLGSYKSYITNNIFDRDAFIADQTPDTKPFVKLLCTSQMFERFLEERIHSQISSGGFERAVSRFGKFAELSTQIMEDEKGISKRNVKKNHVIYGLKSLRGFISKSESPTEVNELTLSTPTLVQSTNDRIVAENDEGNQKTPPPPPPKPSVNKLKMFVPNKSLPAPPPQQSSRPPSALLNALDVANDMAQTNKEKRESRSSSTRHHSPVLYQRNEFNSAGNISVISKPVNNKNNNNNNNNNSNGSTLKSESNIGGRTGGSKRELSRSFSDKSLTESLQMMAASAPPVPPSRQILIDSGSKESLYLTKTPRPEPNKVEQITKQMAPPGAGRGVSGERGGIERGGLTQINSPISRRDRGGLERISDRGSDRGALVKATGERGSERGGVERGGLERGGLERGRGASGERGGLERGGLERGGLERGDRGLMRGSPRRVQPVQRVGPTPPVPGTTRGASPSPIRGNSPVVPPNRGPPLIPSSPDRTPNSNINSNINNNNNNNNNNNILPPVNNHNINNNNSVSSNSRGSSISRGGGAGAGVGGSGAGGSGGSGGGAAAGGSGGSGGGGAAAGRVVVLRGHSHSVSRPLPTPPP